MRNEYSPNIGIRGDRQMFFCEWFGNVARAQWRTDNHIRSLEVPRLCFGLANSIARLTVLATITPPKHLQ